jgi:hypothetical protein
MQNKDSKEISHEYNRTYYLKNKNKFIKKASDWRLLHLEHKTLYDRQYHRDKKIRLGYELNDYNIKKAYERKLKVFQHYSRKEIPECADPFGEHKEPYTNMNALSIDHKNNDGYKHKKEIGGSGAVLYLWLIRNKYPHGFQILCMNCQALKKEFVTKQQYSLRRAMYYMFN